MRLQILHQINELVFGIGPTGVYNLLTILMFKACTLKLLFQNLKNLRLCSKNKQSQSLWMEPLQDEKALLRGPELFGQKKNQKLTSNTLIYEYSRVSIKHVV